MRANLRVTANGITVAARSLHWDIVLDRPQLTIELEHPDADAPDLKGATFGRMVFGSGELHSLTVEADC